MSESEIIRYCETYLVPKEQLVSTLEDQKVLPMIRGRVTEYNAEIFIRKVLPKREWNVEKLNLNPQLGGLDEDVGITFRRTNKRLGIEIKNAVRGSFRLGTQRTIRQVPHFRVKLRRSRSNTKRLTNDRYLPSDFALVMCNVSNSLLRPRPPDPGIHLLDNNQVLGWLHEYYGTDNDMDLFKVAYEDWRFLFADFDCTNRRRWNNTRFTQTTTRFDGGRSQLVYQ